LEHPDYPQNPGHALALGHGATMGHYKMEKYGKHIEKFCFRILWGHGPTIKWKITLILPQKTIENQTIPYITILYPIML